MCNLNHKDTWDWHSASSLLLAPELPPLSIGALAVGLCDLFRQADGLAMPCYVTISGTQKISLQFEPDESSIRAITRWALRFGGLVTSKPDEKDGQHRLFIEAKLCFYGIEVNAYAFIPI